MDSRKDKWSRRHVEQNQPSNTVKTTTFENFVYDMHVNEILIPIDYKTLKKHQAHDEELLKFRTSDSTKLNYKKEVFGRTTFWAKLSHDGRYRIWVPPTLRQTLLIWYHDMLQHPGSQRLEKSVWANFTFSLLSELRRKTTASCDVCSKWHWRV